jgi:hypothetical protein
MQAKDSEPEGAVSLSRSPQFSGVKSVTDRCLTEVMRRRPQSGSLIRSALIDQLLDLTLQPCNSTLATLSPVLKALSLLEEVWPMTEFGHLRTNHAAFGREAMSQEVTTKQRSLRLLTREWEVRREVRILAKLFTWVKKDGNVAPHGGQASLPL